MAKILPLALAITVLLIRPSFADVFKWQDENGVIHYTDDLKKIPEKFRPATGIKRETPEKKKNISVIFRVSVSDVERTSQGARSMTGGRATRIFEHGLFKWLFEDEVIRILWYPEAKMEGMLFELLNKSDYTARIVWDQSSFVDVAGNNHRVMHSGVKFIDRNASQVPSTIIKKGTLKDGFFPTDYVSFERGWRKFPIAGQLGADSIEEARTISQSYLGKSFRFLMPFQVQDRFYEYIFTFTIYEVITD
jgi:hypothetical protein